MTHTVLKGVVKEVVVLYFNLFCCFTLALIQRLFCKTDTNLLVLSGHPLTAPEFADNFFSVVNVFLASQQPTSSGCRIILLYLTKSGLTKGVGSLLPLTSAQFPTVTVTYPL